MAKAKPEKPELTEPDKFYIGANLTKHDEEIARFLKKPVYLVTRYRAEIDPKTPSYQPTRMASLLVTKTASGKGGVTIMTGAASEEGDSRDEVRSKLRARIARAMEEGNTALASELQTELNGLPPEAKPTDIFSDCVGPARRMTN